MQRQSFLFCIFSAILIIVALATLYGAQEAVLPEVRYPKYDEGLDTLQARQKAQLETVNQFKVFYQFHFKDELKESGITFRHHATVYGKERYIRNHYDHGTGSLWRMSMGTGCTIFTS